MQPNYRNWQYVSIELYSTCSVRVMVSFGMLRRVAFVRTDVPEALISSKTSVLTRATRRNMPEGTILHSYRLKSLKPCMLSENRIVNSVVSTRIRDIATNISNSWQTGRISNITVLLGVVTLSFRQFSLETNYILGKHTLPPENNTNRHKKENFTKNINLIIYILLHMMFWM
jgi:hypothetical protein